jgi:hypothetical protein
MDTEKAKQALDTLYIAAGQASLSRPQHDAVTNAAKDLLEQIEGCDKCDGTTPVEVVAPKKDK